MIRALAVVATAWAAASAARYGLVEPPALAAGCDLAPWADLPCAVRTTVVQAFHEQRLGAVSLVLAVTAAAGRWRGLAEIALGLAAAGLVLYNAGLSAPAVLLASLVLAGRMPTSRRETA